MTTETTFISTKSSPRHYPASLRDPPPPPASPSILGDFPSASPNSQCEEMCGDVILEGPDKQKRYVHIKMYRTSIEHFAVVYPLKRLSKPIGIINMKHTRISECEPPAKNTFVINQKMFDVTTSVRFNCGNARQHQKWLDAFRVRPSPAAGGSIVHHTSLPIVTEEDADY